MDSQFVIIIVGFITLLFAVINSTNNLRKEFREDMAVLRSEVKEDIKELKENIKELKEDIKTVNNRVDALNAKLDTLMMMLFKQSWNIPVTKEEGKEAA